MSQHIPLGIRDFLPDEIDYRMSLINGMKQVVSEHGYQRIITPTIEHYDTIASALGTDLKSRCIVFFDSSQTRLTLRPDHTSAIARIVSTRMASTPTIKWYYYDAVFRRDKRLGETETLQFGCEHIGAIGIHDEATMIQLAIQLCMSIGVSAPYIYISHTDVFSTYSPTERNQVKTAIFSEMALPTVRPIHKATTHPYAKLLHKKLPTNYMSHVFFHHGLYKDPTYYNGLYFDIVCSTTGTRLGSGGRYDAVLHAFGSKKHAVGFALDLPAIEKAIQ